MFRFSRCLVVVAVSFGGFLGTHAFAESFDLQADDPSADFSVVPVEQPELKADDDCLSAQVCIDDVQPQTLNNVKTAQANVVKRSSLDELTEQQNRQEVAGALPLLASPLAVVTEGASTGGTVSLGLSLVGSWLLPAGAAYYLWSQPVQSVVEAPMPSLPENLPLIPLAAYAAPRPLDTPILRSQSSRASTPEQCQQQAQQIYDTCMSYQGEPRSLAFTETQMPWPTASDLIRICANMDTGSCFNKGQLYHGFDGKVSAEAIAKCKSAFQPALAENGYGNREDFYLNTCLAAVLQ